MKSILTNRKVATISVCFTLMVLCALNQWLFSSWLNNNYLHWYSQTGPFIALASAVISVAWGDLDKHRGLISANPLVYTGSCLQAAGLPLMAFGMHLRKQNRLTPLGVNIVSLLLLSVVLLCAILSWLILIVPVQYFVFLVTGAFSRTAELSTAHLIANVKGTRVNLQQCNSDRLVDVSAGEWDASMRDKPFTLTNAFTAALLLLINMIVG